MSAYLPYAQSAVYGRGQQSEVFPSSSLQSSLPLRGQNMLIQQRQTYNPGSNNRSSRYQQQLQSPYQPVLQQQSQLLCSPYSQIRPYSSNLAQSNLPNSQPPISMIQQAPLQSSISTGQYYQQNYIEDPIVLQPSGYISNKPPMMYASNLSRNSQNDQDIQIQTYSPMQLSRNSAVIDGLVDQTLRNIKTGGSVQHQKRDQNYFFSSYITISGVGTYKKYPLKSRHNNNNNSSSNSGNYTESKQSQVMQSQQYDAPVPAQQFMASLIEIARAEESSEAIKAQLVKQPDYNIPTFFSFFDKNQSGKTSLSEFNQGIKDFGSTLSQAQAALIFSRAVPSAQTLLYYDGFSTLFLPQLTGSGSIGKSVTSQRVQEVEINPKTIDLFRKLLNSLSLSEQLIDSLRKRLTRTSTNIMPFFRQLNIEKNNRLTISELQTALKNYNDATTAAQASLLFYRACNKQMTNMSYEEFEIFCFGGQKGNNSSSNNSKLQRSQIPQQQQYPQDDVSQSLLRSQFPSTLKVTDYSAVLTKFALNAKLESDIDVLQKSLAEKQDLNLNILFSLFKPTRNNNVDAYQFSEALKNIYGIPLVDINDVMLLYRKVQGGFRNIKRKLDEISFTEFCSLLAGEAQNLPKQAYQRSQNESVSPETILLISKIFKVHLNNEVLFNQIRLYISTNEISIPGIFNSLCNNKKYVDQNDFDTALKANGSTCPSQYHDLTFRRFDPKNEGVFDVTFFSNALKI